MKKFSDFPVVKEYKHPEKTRILKYIELMFNKSSDLIKIENFDERIKAACSKAGIKPEDHQNLITLKKDSQEANLVFIYLSHHQNNNKFHNLIADQVLLWRMQRIMMESDKSEIDQSLKWSKEVEALSNRIDTRMSEIYGAPAVMEVASTEIRKVIALPRVEARLREELGESA